MFLELFRTQQQVVIDLLACALFGSELATEITLQLV